jgi:UDP-N-acetylmuramoylalanine--D-glutamate ligase
MTMTRDFHGKTVVVAGMAKSGFGAVEILLRHGARVRAVDSKPDDAMRARLAPLGVELAPQTPEAFLNSDLIVLAPGVPVEVVPAGAGPVIGEVELAGYYLQGPTIAITGSNGKTTTTALVGHVLERSGIACQVGGNIGTAPTAMIDSSRPDQWNVLELSSFQLETIHDFRARIAVCLNITQNHLDRHRTIENYAKAKARLVETQDENGYAVLNRDNPFTASFATRTMAHVVWFSMKQVVNPGFFLDGTRIVGTGGILMDIGEIRLRGMHNVENVMAAAAACHIAGASLEQIRAGVMSFEGVEHRIEFVRKLDGVDYYNDSKATSVDATLKAIDAFPGGLWIILGGKDKGSDYSPLRDPLGRKAHAALLVGAAGPKIAAHLEGAVPLLQCGDIATAVRTARDQAAPGDTVLLAPACASFDQFRSFEHRGETFKEIVRGLEVRKDATEN